MVSHQDISNTKTEEALFDLLCGVIDVNRHSILVESLKDKPEQFYIDPRSSLAVSCQQKLRAIAKQLVVLRSS